MKILVTGGSGMVGSAFKEVKTEDEIILIDRKRADLKIKESFKEVLWEEEPDIVIHLAAKVGGVKGNTDFVADFYSDNILINTNVLNCCKDLKIPKVVSLLSTCVYPDSVDYPLTEDQIHKGPPHKSNFGYAYAKRMIDVHSRALRNQYGCNFVCAVPNNLYGKNDNFDLENGHVIPAIIRKIWEANHWGSPPVFWGDGSPLREFTYSRDIAEILLFLGKNYNDPEPINIGNTEEFTIKNIVKKVCDILNYNGDIHWDHSKPAGQQKKPSDNTKLVKMGWKNTGYTSIDHGLKITCNWFLENFPNIRGIKN